MFDIIYFGAILIGFRDYTAFLNCYRAILLINAVQLRFIKRFDLN